MLPYLFYNHYVKFQNFFIFINIVDKGSKYKPDPNINAFYITRYIVIPLNITFYSINYDELIFQEYL